MKHTSRVITGLMAGLALVLLGGGAVAPALANKPPLPCEPVSGKVAIRQDMDNSLQMAGDILASDRGTHSAAFDEAGLRFSGKTSGRGATADVGMTLATVSQGGKSLRVKARPAGEKGSARSWSMCNNLAYRERADGLIEAVGVYSDHIDLAYVLQKPVFAKTSKKDLKLTVNLSTGMTAELTSNGLLLTDQYLNGVLIGMPTAIDAAGKTQPLQMIGDDSALTIVVPGKWLAKAEYPVTIDPVVTTWSHASDAQYQPFTANDASSEQMLVVFTDKSGGDYDVRYRLVDTTNGNILHEDVVTDSGEETSGVVGYNPKGASGDPEYMVAYARNDRLFAQRVDAATGALIGSEINNKNVKLGGGRPADAALDTKSGKMVVVWSANPAPGDVKGVLINEAGSFASAGFEIAGTGYDERHPRVTFDSKLTKNGSFVASWKQTNKNSYSILARPVSTKNGGGGTAITLKGSSSVNVTNRKLIFSADADSESTNPGKFLAVWNRVDNNDLVGLRINNRTSSATHTLAVTGGSFVIKAGKSKGWKFNDKTDAFPDLATSRKGWVVVWRERNHTELPMVNTIHWVTIKETGSVGTIQDVIGYDMTVTKVDNPEVVVLEDGTVVTVHEEIPTSTGVNTLIFTLN